MAKTFLTAVDLGKNELQNPRAQQLASDPGSPVTGQFYYNTTANEFRVWNGSSWAAMGSVTFGTVTSQTSYGASSSNGAASTASRSDHVHGTVALSSNAASTQAFGDAATNGSGTAPAKDDHKHAMPSLANATAATTFGLSVSNGVATSAARSDHHHGTPAHDAAAHSAIKISDLAAPTASVAFNSQKITGLLDPTAAQDAATKAYVDSVSIGLDVKASVRVATTAAGTLATSFENGDTVDGVVLATGNRILIKNQASGAENGIYTVNASGAPTRAIDADSSAEVTDGMFTFVTEGTTNADTGWVLTTNDTITLGSTALVFTQFSGAGAITAGTGLTQSGTTINAVGTTNRISVAADSIDIDAAYVGQTSITTLGTITTGTWTGTDIAVLDGGTGASTAAGARTNLGATGKYAVDVGNGALTSITVTHNLGTLDVITTLYTNSGGAVVECDVVNATTNTVTLGFTTAPTSNQYRCVVIG